MQNTNISNMSIAAAIELYLCYVKTQFPQMGMMYLKKKNDLHKLLSYTCKKYPDMIYVKQIDTMYVNQITFYINNNEKLTVNNRISMLDSFTTFIYFICQNSHMPRHRMAFETITFKDALYKTEKR